jgi:hypothetical protein
MQDKLYSTPLHGVECILPAQIATFPSLKPLRLVFNTVSMANIGAPVWSLLDKGQRYATELKLYKADNRFILDVNCEGKGKFEVSAEQVSVDWLTGTPSSHYFQTIGLALWLELQGVLCIHGNGLAYQQHTFAVVASSGTGKSTLSSQLQQQGCQWLTDDMMALHHDGASDAPPESFSIYPSWPIARLWPDSVENVSSANVGELDKVHDRFSKRQLSLANKAVKIEQKYGLSTIYLLDRIDKVTQYDKPKCKIEDLTSSQALILLLQHSMLGDAYSALGVEAQRVELLSRVINVVKVKKVTYTSGKGNLELLSKRILDDLDKHQG